MTERSARRDFRSLLKPGAAVVLPGVSNALAARVVADLGFAAAYVTGAGIANTYLGIPDNGLVTLTELADHVAAIRGVFAGPLMVDADTGFGNAVNLVRTVKLLGAPAPMRSRSRTRCFPSGADISTARRSFRRPRWSPRSRRGRCAQRSGFADRGAHRRHRDARLPGRDRARQRLSGGRRRRELRRGSRNLVEDCGASTAARGPSLPIGAGALDRGREAVASRWRRCAPRSANPDRCAHRPRLDLGDHLGLRNDRLAVEMSAPLGNTWSSIWIASAPARSRSLTVRTRLTALPKPVSASTISGPANTPRMAAT